MQIAGPPMLLSDGVSVPLRNGGDNHCENGNERVSRKEARERRTTDAASVVCTGANNWEPEMAGMPYQG